MPTTTDGATCTPLSALPCAFTEKDRGFTGTGLAAVDVNVDVWALHAITANDSEITPMAEKDTAEKDNVVKETIMRLCTIYKDQCSNC
ncbi:MAG: hypothetical protein PHC51_03970 [bacterium]|nr:hypothetical protein [bacterium]